MSKFVTLDRQKLLTVMGGKKNKDKKQATDKDQDKDKDKPKDLGDLLKGSDKNDDKQKEKDRDYFRGDDGNYHVPGNFLKGKKYAF